MLMKCVLPIFLLLLLSCSKSPVQPEAVSRSRLFTNPLLESGADPWVIRADSMYHYCYSRQGSIHIKSVKDVPDLKTAEAVNVWTPPPNMPYSKELWAPELHYLQGKWYIYVAADDGENANHRMYVLASKGATVDSGFEFVGQIGDETNKWAIDGTVLSHSGKLYFIWSGWAGDENVAQDLYIAEMTSPTEIGSARALISTPEYDWETGGAGNGLPTINEGPEILQKNGKVYLTYSASGSWSDFYCLGMLELTGDNPLDPASWTKFPTPIFQGSDCVVSPGHASFITIGQQDWIVYHANRLRGGGWQNRYVKMQPFYWDGDKPIFGQPVSDGVVLKIEY